MTAEMTTAHFDQTLATVLSAAVCGILFCAAWIIIILIDIEATKVSFLMVDGSSKGMDLQLDVTTDDASNPSGMEIEPSESQERNEPEIKAKRTRRVSFQFKLMQVGSVALLILLTYLLLVASNASAWLSALGAISVFGMFLRFQIGDEIRQQRWDRLLLMMSLLLLVAGFLHLGTYAGKALDQGEIYMGPARIVGYDISAYNNTNKNDPTTRTNLVVQWGSDWGCPFSGGKNCEAEVQGVMCAVNPDGNRRIKRRGLVNSQASATANGAGKNHHSNATAHGNATHAGSGKHVSSSTNNKDTKLEKENEDLEKENEELKKEVEELKEKNDEEVDEMYDSENVMEEELIGDALVEDSAIIDANEDKEKALADEDIAEQEFGKEHTKEQLEDATDDTFKEDLQHNIDLMDEEEDETEADLNLELDEDEDEADEYEDLADEYFDNEENAMDEEIDAYIDEQDTEAEIDETEAEIDEMEEQLNADGWTFEYDDDMFENEYWNYDWDSAWGDYGCGDLFDSDIDGQIHDPSIPAGADDSWPYINIYGSCKRCDAYVLDYFAGEAFEKLDIFVMQGVMFMVLGFTGISISFVGFIKYKLSPPAENEIELLGSEAGVIA